MIQHNPDMDGPALRSNLEQWVDWEYGSGVTSVEESYKINLM